MADLMKRLFLLLIGTIGIAAAPIQLESRVHFVHEWEGGDGIKLYYPISDGADIKSVVISGLPLKSWRVLKPFRKFELELVVNIKPGLDTTFSRLQINGSSVYVAPSRVFYFKPLVKYALSYEKLEQEPTNALFIAMQIFNDSADTLTIEKILYAPKGVSADRVLIHPRYDSKFFLKIEDWLRSGAKGYPAGVTLENAMQLNLKILPSRGFAAAIVTASFATQYNCKLGQRPRDIRKRYDTLVAQPIIQYRIGTGKSLFYPIPDQIIADICP